VLREDGRHPGTLLESRVHEELASRDTSLEEMLLTPGAH
jgi:hypothetical protein